MTTLIATDLDRTMIYSRSAMELAAGEKDVTDPAAQDDLLCVEVYDGKPLSYVTTAAESMLRRLADTTVVVPTTTRTVAQFQRIELPGAPWRYAITTNGGNILVDGVPDEGWRSDVDAAIAAGAASLSEIGDELARRVDDSWVRSSRIADELFSYLVVDVDAMPTGFVEDWDAWCSDRGWGASRQGRKVYTMPKAVCKSRAVAEVRARLVKDGVLEQGTSVLAAGDGALDAAMLSKADAAIRPRHGELEALDWQHPSVAVTDSSGIAAGEEILRWFWDRVECGAGSTPAASPL
ncbi:HAD family hydrolase [Rhodococcus sp. NPDC049939]|uniref:HAD family hydrolase n=1 Tax=Rhodococcus sp. NPDC049939 TaxID=3155511 RepID=UPI0033CA2661